MSDRTAVITGLGVVTSLGDRVHGRPLARLRANDRQRRTSESAQELGGSGEKSVGMLPGPLRLLDLFSEQLEL